VAWATTEKRTFLRQRIEIRLAGLHLEHRDYTAALNLLGKLVPEVKRLDDKLLLVDVHLLESKVGTYGVVSVCSPLLRLQVGSRICLFCVWHSDILSPSLVLT
jgi:hypothetical protein